MGNQKKKPEPAGLVAIISFIAGIVILFAGKNNKTPVVSLAGFFVAFFGVMIAGLMQNASAKKNMPRSAKGTAGKYVPLFMDERTKQHPEIQRLLQYMSVQKAFFDPAYLGTAEAQNDPYVRELLGVLDSILAEQTANGVYPPPAQGGFKGARDLERECDQDEITRRKREKNKPRRIAGAVLAIVGFAMFIAPFFAGKAAGTLFWIDPIGMAMIVVGNILWKR